MTTQSLELVVQNKLFFPKITMVGINGLLGPRHAHILQFAVESAPFALNGEQYVLHTSVNGGFKLDCPTDEMMSQFSITDEEVDQANAVVISRIFDRMSSHFAFDKDELNAFFHGQHLTYFKRLDNKPYSIRDILIPDDLQQSAFLALKCYLTELSFEFYKQSLPEQKQFKKLFNKIGEVA